MAYLIGLTWALVAVSTLPLSVSAQAGEVASSPDRNLQEPAPSSEAAQDEGGLSPGVRKRTRKKWDPQTYDVPESRPSSKEPAFQVELDSTGADFALIRASQSPKRGLDSRQRAGIGLGVSVVAFAAGLGMGMAALGGSICISFGEPCSRPSWVAPVGITSALLAGGGVIGMAVSGSALRSSKRNRDDQSTTPQGTARRVQWDLQTACLVF